MHQVSGITRGHCEWLKGYFGAKTCSPQDLWLADLRVKGLIPQELKRKETTFLNYIFNMGMTKLIKSLLGKLLFPYFVFSPLFCFIFHFLFLFFCDAIRILIHFHKQVENTSLNIFFSPATEVPCS